MNVSDPLVLRSDVVLVPVTELAPEVRAKFESDAGDYTVSRLHGRMPSQVIDGETASLLQIFRRPTTIVDAVIRNSRDLAKDPASWLDEILPHLDGFLRNHVLVPAGSDEERELRPLLDAGARVNGWEVVRCVHLMEESEIYRVQRDGVEGAMKIARAPSPGASRHPLPASGARGTREGHRESKEQGSREELCDSEEKSAQETHGDGEEQRTREELRESPSPRLRGEGARRADEGTLFDNESEVLESLDRLLDCGAHDGRAYCVTEWHDGTDATTASSYGRHDRASILALCTSVAGAYAELHERGVVHGDVHPRNLIIGAHGSVRIIDFGLSRIDGRSTRHVPRGGMYTFFEPEYLAAVRNGQQRAASFAGEQYAVAALLYLLITGTHYVDFRLEREEMMRQAETEPPLPFAARRIPPWPEVESIIFRALEKDPARRFESMRAFAEALRAVQPTSVALSEEARQLVDEELASLARGGALFTDGCPKPHASVNYGAAGAAMALLRIASVRNDARLLALADVWRSRAALYATSPDGWYDEEHELPHSMLGDVSPYHSPAGLYAVSALLAWARNDRTLQRSATHSFIDTAQLPCDSIDLTLGRSGTLLAAALLRELGDEVHALGDALARDLWQRLDALPPLRDQPPDTYLGIAHGWSGYLYATLRWSRAAGTPLPSTFVTRLDELAELRVARGRGAWWPRQLGGGAHDMMAGWCNGAAGHVFTWTAAYDALRDERWLALAELAAWNAWEEPLHHADLCCGSAGRAYALLNLYKNTGDRDWLARACQLANHAAGAARSTAQRPHALWKGELGIAALIADLEVPESAAMPLFE
jgi:serine/threonine protein kinase